MERFAKTGDFCPYAECSECGKLQDEKQKTIQKYGKTKRGVQRYQCCACKRTFTATTGTIFYGKHTSEDEILETLALLAEATGIDTLAVALGSVHSLKTKTVSLDLDRLKAIRSRVTLPLVLHGSSGYRTMI
jgi:transposase-like protein